MQSVEIINENKKLPDRIHMDFNLIEMPLFSQNSKSVPNIGAIYTIDKKRNIQVQVIPGVGLAIPNDFDQKVYLALVHIAMEFKEKYGLSVVENKVYTTYYEIFTKLKMTMKGNINERIYMSLKKLKATQYDLWNCCYQADSGIIAGLYSASFINDIKIMNKESQSAKTAMTYIGITKSENVIELTLHEFFLHNILNKRGNLVHKYYDLISLKDSIARTIYLYCEKNRSWIGKRYYNTDKKMKISAKKLANTIPLAWASTNIPKTVNRIRTAFEFLKEKCLITDFIEYRGKPLVDTWYEVGFGWSRDDKDYVLTGRENFAITEINEIEAVHKNNIEIEEIKEVDFANGKVTKIIANNVVEASKILNNGNELDKILEKISNKISKPTREIINNLFIEKGIEFIKSSIGYALLNAKKNFDKYLKDTLINEWAELKQLDFCNNQQAQENKDKEKIKSKKLKEEQLNYINKNEIEHEFYKLNDINKNTYTQFAAKILKKYASKLILLLNEDPEATLAMSIYAVSNNKYYNRAIELYCEKSLNINLNIYKL